MIYNIKAIPTTYGGVNFRSRLEARWAAFFDLCGWKWDYEPFDLNGWAPDFIIKTRRGNILVEVKPVDIERIVVGTENAKIFDKAIRYSDRYQIMLLGVSPVEKSLAPGSILNPPKGSGDNVEDIIVRMCIPHFNLDTGECFDEDELWRDAGNKVQWSPTESSFRRIAA